MAIARKIRWRRFGLRALFLLMTAAVLASWVYWDGWERWKWHRNQQQFLAQATELTCGSLISDRWRPDLENYGPPFVSDHGSYDAKGRFTRYLACRWPNALYVVFWKFKGSRCTSVEVFGLPTAPSNYTAQTKRSKIDVGVRAKQLANPRPGQTYRIADDSSQLAYKLDFVEMISGDRRDDLGFDYVLLYSDPSPAIAID